MTARQSVGCVHRDIMDKPGQLTNTLSANTTHSESLWWTSCSKSKTQSYPELQLTWISQTSCCGLSTLCDWLQAPLITAVGLGLSDDATRVAVADRLGSKACELDTGKAVDARGLHWLSYGTGQAILDNNVTVIWMTSRGERSSELRCQLEVRDGLWKLCTSVVWTETRAAIHWVTRTTDLLPCHIINVARTGRIKQLLLTKVSDGDRNVKSK